MELLLVLKQCGPIILAVAVLLFDGWARETRVSKHIARLENEYHQGGLGGWPLSLLRPPRRGGDSGGGSRTLATWIR